MPPFLWTLSPLPVALALAPLCGRLAVAVGLVDVPRRDRFGGRSTPKLGGLVVVLALLPAAVHALATGADPVFVAGLAGFLPAFLTGLLDDVRNLPPRTKLLGQVLAAILTVWLLAREVPAAGLLADLPAALVVPAGVVWIIAFQNAVNFLDNMDGIVAGVVSIGLVALGFQLPPEWRAFPLGVAAALVGFLPWNASSPARLYLGDAGALPLGHALGYASLVVAWTASSIGHGAASLVVVAIPVLDITFVTITRLAAGRSPAQGGRDHTTHRLFARLQSVSLTRRIFWLSALVLGGVSFWIRSLAAPFAIGALVVALLACILVGRKFASMPTPDALTSGD